MRRDNVEYGYEVTCTLRRVRRTRDRRFRTGYRDVETTDIVSHMIEPGQSSTVELNVVEARPTGIFQAHVVYPIHCGEVSEWEVRL